MTATTSKAVREAAPAKPVARLNTRPGGSRFGREFGKLAFHAYEQVITKVAAFEKDAATIAPYPWMREALTVSAELIEDVTGAHLKAARRTLQ